MGQHDLPRDLPSFDIFDGVLRDRTVPVLDRWLRLAGILTAGQFVRFLDASMNLMIVLEHEFERRFPAECAAWRRKNDLE